MTAVYRGDLAYVHIEDGNRAKIGAWLASTLEQRVRNDAADRSRPEDDLAPWGLSVCPGCYMVAVFHCAVALAKANGQSLSELGNSLGQAFLQLAQDGDYLESIESIEVQLDSSPCVVEEQA